MRCIKLEFSTRHISMAPGSRKVPTGWVSRLALVPQRNLQPPWKKLKFWHPLPLTRVIWGSESLTVTGRLQQLGTWTPPWLAPASAAKWFYTNEAPTLVVLGLRFPVAAVMGLRTTQKTCPEFLDGDDAKGSLKIHPDSMECSKYLLLQYTGIETWPQRLRKIRETWYYQMDNRKHQKR